MSAVENYFRHQLEAVVAPLVERVAELKDEVAALREHLPPMLLRPAEVEKRYGMSPQFQRRAVKAGRLRAVKLGRMVLIDVSTLHAR